MQIETAYAGVPGWARGTIRQTSNIEAFYGMRLTRVSGPETLVSPQAVQSTDGVRER